MSQALAERTERTDFSKIEQVLILGDLSRLSEEERVSYYRAVCESVGLNPLTKPFDYINLGGKLVLYAKKDATDQLRKLHHVSIRITGREKIGDVYVVTAHAKLPDGREDESTGAVAALNLKGDFLANAYMKAETKAKRRATLSICGLGLLDETEVEDIPSQTKDVKAEVVEPTAPMLEESRKEEVSVRRPSEAQMKRFWAIKASKNYSDEKIKGVMKEWFGNESTRDLTLEQYNRICDAMQAGLV